MVNTHFPYRRAGFRQRGAVLITGLVFLVVLLMIVVSIMRSGTLEERMASNARDRQLALQAAEAVLRDAAATLFSSTPVSPMDPFDIAGFPAACSNGLCGVPTSGTPRWRTPSMWTDTTKTRTFASSSSKISALPDSAQPRYIVEPVAFEGGQVGRICPKVIYKVTARAVGLDNATVFLESMYRIRPNTFADGTCG